MKIIFLFLALNVNDTRVMENKIDDVSFFTVKQCEQYKQKMHYSNTEHMKFTCKRD